MQISWPPIQTPETDQWLSSRPERKKGQPLPVQGELLVVEEAVLIKRPLLSICPAARPPSTFPLPS